MSQISKNYNTPEPLPTHQDPPVKKKKKKGATEEPVKLVDPKQLSTNEPDKLVDPKQLFTDNVKVDNEKATKETPPVKFVEASPEPELPATILTLGSDPHQFMFLKPGEKFAIKVPSNPSTGYSWKMAADNATADGKKYVSHAKDHMVIGAGGDQYFIFTAPQKGEAKIDLTHGQQWDEKTHKNYSFNITIQEPVNIDNIIQVDFSNPNQTLNLKPGEEFAIKVNSNGTTGYSWDMSAHGLVQRGEKFMAHTPDPRIIGSGGDLYYIFKAPQEGSGEINLTHGRPWDPESQKAYNFKVNVN